MQSDNLWTFFFNLLIFLRFHMFFIERIQIPANVIMNIQQGNGRLNFL